MRWQVTCPLIGGYRIHFLFPGKPYVLEYFSLFWIPNQTIPSFKLFAMRFIIRIQIKMDPLVMNWKTPVEIKQPTPLFSSPSAATDL